MASRSDEDKIKAKLARIYSKFVPQNGCLVPAKEGAASGDGYLRYRLLYPDESVLLNVKFLMILIPPR